MRTRIEELSSVSVITPAACRVDDYIETEEITAEPARIEEAVITPLCPQGISSVSIT